MEKSTYLTNEVEPDAKQNLMQALWKSSPFMTGVIMAHLILIGVCFVGLAFDPRTVLNEPVWIKPLKFAISSFIYCGTIAWMLTFVTRGRWIARLIAGATALLMIGELSGVVIQAFRGVRSHFNFATEFDRMVFETMGLMITLLWVVNLILILLLIFQPFKDGAFKTALLAGTVIALIGGAVAMPMIEQVTPAQQAALDRGESLTFEGGHTIGAEDGGPGLPFVGWSTTHGDLRPAHFIGLHALQLIPLLGLMINWLFGSFTVGRRAALVLVGSAAYLGVVYALFQQAMNQLPITSFDTTTLLILIGVALGSGTLATLIIRSGNQKPAADDYVPSGMTS